MNYYIGDTRYEKVWEQMQLLGIEDVTSKRQAKNGTRVWKLPIKNNNNGKTNIEVASFKTGYVRNNNSGYSNYQLNKRGTKDRYWPEVHSEWIDSEYVQTPTGKYSKYTSKTCKLIPIEIDRLEYLISYCLKNYYIKHANFVADGEYVSKWIYDNLADAAKLDYDCGQYDRIRDLEEKLENMTEARDWYKNSYDDFVDGGKDRIKDLESKLQSIIKTARH